MKDEMIKSALEDLKRDWKPETRFLDLCYYADDYEPFLYYFDEYRSEWTTKDRAFQGYVLKRITPIIEGVNLAS